LAALGADRFEDLPGTGADPAPLSHRLATLAAFGFVGESLLGEELLLAGRKGEFLAAIYTD
jgi:hypothetical protein